MKPERILKLGLVLALGWTGVATAQPAPEPPAADTAPDQSSVSDQEALRIMGYMMAQQLRLNVGFSEAELDTVFDGMRAAARGEPAPDNLRDALPVARKLYMQKVADFQEAEQKRLEAEAAVNKAEAEAFLKDVAGTEDLQSTESGLHYVILQPGNDEKKATPNDRVKVNYLGKRIDGTVFDQSPEGEPVAFGVTQVVPGFGEGLQLVGEGGKIRLYIPSELAYGDSPPPGSKIEAGDMLVFDVEIDSIVELPKAGEPVYMGPGAAPGAPPKNLPPPPPPPTLRPPGPPPGAPPSTRPPGPPPHMKPKPAPSTDEAKAGTSDTSST